MPIIMDNDDYMDDLFGDNEDVAPMVVPVVVKGLQTRLDELRTIGCCCKIAWSAQNCVASITDDGDAVAVRTLFRRPKDCKWILSDQTPLRIPQLREDFQPINISWGPLGSDLAVSDVFGRVLIFNLGYAQGKMQIRGSSPLDRVDETNVIIGMRWLPILSLQQRFNMFRVVTRNNDNNWVYRLSSHKRLEPSNPLDGKSALFLVTMNGLLRLLFQQQADGRWNEVKADLEYVSSSLDFLTHAALGCDSDGSYYVVTVNSSRQLQLYSIRVDWRSAQSQQAAPKSTQVSPTLLVRPVLLTGSDRLCAPSPVEPADESNEQDSRNMAVPQLSHLLFMPAAPETVGQGMARTTLLAVCSYSPEQALSSNVAYLHNNPFSVICRWEIVKSKVTIHPILQSLARKKNSAANVPASSDVVSFKRLPDISVNGIIVSAASLYNDTVLSLSYSDGSVEFRNRPALDIINADHNPNQVSSLSQSGFSFPTGNPFLNIALSPNNCLAAYMKADGVVKLLSMEYLLGSFRASDNDPKLSAAIVALAMQHFYSCRGYHSADDIFAVMARDMSKAWEHFFLMQAYQSLNTGVDFMSEESQKQALVLFHVPPLLRCLSVQHLFGLEAGGRRDLAGKFAWIMLNLRLSFINLASSKEDWNYSMFVSCIYVFEISNIRMDTVFRLCQTVKWFFDLATYIVHGLINLSASMKQNLYKRDDIQREVEKMNSPAIFLLVTSASRVLIRMITRQIRHAVQLSLAAMKSTSNTETSKAYPTFLTVLNRSPIHIQHLELLVTELDPLARRAYTIAQKSDVECAAVEKAMLTTCELPEILTPVVQHLLTSQLDKLQDEIDPARVFFADLRWLNLTEDLRTQDFNGERCFDVIQKTYVKPGVPLRQCTRCGALTVDIDAASSKNLGTWLHNAQKSCVCGNQWLAISAPGAAVVEQG